MDMFFEGRYIGCVEESFLESNPNFRQMLVNAGVEFMRSEGDDSSRYTRIDEMVIQLFHSF